MGSLFSKIQNTVEYRLDSIFSDPKADEYAKQKAAQDQQDQQVAASAAAAQEQADANKKATATSTAAAQVEVERSQFNGSRLRSNTASNILKIVLTLIVIAFCLYGGSLAANDAIGYRVPFRIFSFMYGCLFSWIVVPRYMYYKLWLNQPMENHGFFPLGVSVTEPTGVIDSLFYYVEDSATRTARDHVEALYKAGGSGASISLPKLPSLPKMPAMPTIPVVPAMPAMPTIPVVPAMPAMPTMSAMPAIPAVPVVPKLVSSPKAQGV